MDNKSDLLPLRRLYKNLRKIDVIAQFLISLLFNYPKTFVVCIFGPTIVSLLLNKFIAGAAGDITSSIQAIFVFVVFYMIFLQILYQDVQNKTVKKIIDFWLISLLRTAIFINISIIIVIAITSVVTSMVSQYLPV
ncbi:MAG: hypothetical protein HRU38_13060 [Saccharospirillaceae bacterium]|nr:hypothetical protein [Pseudomonadales bacterium]NRB79573.1 hypothetical protein [Saccharospirillaceae bacterium]